MNAAMENLMTILVFLILCSSVAILTVGLALWILGKVEK